MTILASSQPAIVLVDDDHHSARLMTRMLAAHDGPPVSRIADPDEAAANLTAAAGAASDTVQPMVLVDLKSSSAATGDFVARLKREVPSLLVVAMAPSLDRDTRNTLLDAGAAAVFERHADLELYRREAASIVSFWVRNQRLDAVGA